jgi:ATP-dependent exoDNAse (exonuclease V) beta subunit
MKRFGFGQGLAAAAIVLSFAVAASSQDEGVKKIELLAKKSGATVEAIANTKVQLMKTMDVYNALMADGATDRKGLYKKLQSEMAATEKRRSEITLRADEMKAEADTLFKSWADSAAAISDADLRKASDERLAKTKQGFAEIGTVGQKATELYGPVMKALQDQVTYLGHDLNPSAVASLKPSAAKLNDQSKELVKRIDDTITTANTAIGALRPQ